MPETPEIVTCSSTIPFLHSAKKASIAAESSIVSTDQFWWLVVGPTRDLRESYRSAVHRPTGRCWVAVWIRALSQYPGPGGRPSQELTAFLCTAAQLAIVLLSLVLSTPLQIEALGINHGPWIEICCLVLDSGYYGV